MKTVLVTGASGFAGRALVAALAREDYRVLPFSSQQGDIERDALPDAAADHVFHLAARTFVPDSWKQPDEFYRVNVLGTARVLEYCRARGAGLTMLSSYVYGRPDALPIREDHPLRAANPYGQTKVLAEELCRFYELSYQVPVTIIRPFNLYGPGQPAHFLIPELIAQARSRETDEIVVQDETPRRDYLFLTDLIDLLTRVVKDPKPGAFNAGLGRSYSVGEIAATINSLLTAPKKFRTLGQSRPNEIPDVVADIGKARDTFGWQPRVSLETGLRLLLDAE